MLVVALNVLFVLDTVVGTVVSLVLFLVVVDVLVGGAGVAMVSVVKSNSWSPGGKLNLKFLLHCFPVGVESALPSHLGQ